ncbi:MAG: tetratricopeptide repeat protein [Lachnospiraceae bacterium]|nr:tetratricopeptide repeat protein [Lachnospiraceae bacterium]
MRDTRFHKVIVAGMLLATCFFTGCSSKPANTNINKGMELLEQMDYSGALESFEAALVYKEDEQLIYRGEGLANMGLGNYEEAANCLLQSISYANGNVTNLEFDTNYYLATAYYKQGKYDEAEKIYTAILNLRDKETDAYYLRACTLLKEGYYDAAIKDFEKAFSLEPDNLELVTDAFVEMQAAGFSEEGKVYLQEFLEKKDKQLKDAQKGTIYFYLEDYANARIYLDGALNQGNPEVSLILGRTYEKLGDMNYAVVVYQTYLDSNAPDAAIYNSLGVCLMNQGKYQEALEAFESGINLGDTPYIQNLRYNQIVAKEYLGSFAEAKKLMEEYLAAYPDDGMAKQEYEFLQTR